MNCSREKPIRKTNDSIKYSNILKTLKSTNTYGSFTCACLPGFNGDGFTCTDIDECALGTDDCDINADCTDILGGYECDCIAGWKGNGTFCENLDECTGEDDRNS